jgi:hypothetical protein
MKIGYFSIALLLFFLTSCQADNEYSLWPCRFAYDNSLHLDATLASALDVNSPGIFCKISESSQAGVKYLVFENNHRQKTSLGETEEEKRAEYILGLNNGIIVGFQNGVRDEFGNAIFTAYDIQCPNCVRREGNTTNPNYGVSMSETGIATCQKCGKKYDMNNGGVVQNGEEGDKGLEKYAASTTGPLGHVSVFRHR